MGKQDDLINRLNENLSDYISHVHSFERQAITDMAGRINAVQDTHFYMTEHHAYQDEQIDYLLQFQNPLEVVADAWERRTSDISDMSFALDEVFDKQDALQDYPLITDATPQKGRSEPATRDNTQKPSIMEQLTEAAKEAATRPQNRQKTSAQDKEAR